MKKVLALLISISIIAGVGLPSGTALAADGGSAEPAVKAAPYDDYFIPIIVEDESVTQRDEVVSMVVDGGELLVDVSAFSGADIEVSVSEGSALIQNDCNEITLVADSDVALIDNGRVSFSADITENNGVLYAPIDELALLCGIEKTLLDGETVYYKPFQTLRLIVEAKGRLPEVSEISKSIDSLGNIILDFDSQQATEAAYDILSECKNVVSVSGEDVYYALDTPSDEYGDYLSWGAEYIGSPYVVEYAETLKNRKTLTVAIVDTGIDSDHPYLENRLSDRTPSGIEDIVGHGTHCAGIVAANTPDNVELLPVKGLTSKTGSGSDSDIAEAINYAVENGADIISMSLGGTDFGGNVSMKAAIKRAYDAGCILVAAAGNEKNDASKCFPANSDYCIAVGASDFNGQPASFSNYGSVVDVSAPGVSIYSTYLNGGYKAMSGTSMSTPFVAAACATDFTINGKRKQGDELSRLVSSVTPFSRYLNSSRYKYGAGIISYYGYLDREMVMPVTFSVESGFYDKLFNLEMSCATSGAEIYYISGFDESVLNQIPSPENGTLYQSPIVISGNTYVVAAAYCDGYLRSKTTSAEYSFNDYDVDENYIVDENGCLTGYLGDFEILSVPEYVNGIQVTSVGIGAFSGNSKLISVNLPDSVTSLGASAFQDCSALTHVRAKGVTEIPFNCFDFDISLSSLQFGAVTSIGSSALCNCSHIDENNFDLSSVEYIGDYALSYSGYTNIELYNIKSLGENAFYGCKFLKSVSLPNMKILGKAVFNNCNSLETVRLDNALMLSDNAFSGCTALQNIEAENLQVIGDRVFENCESLASVNFPKLVQVGYYSFSNCAFETVTLPSVKQLGEGVFSYCNNLKTVNLPELNYLPSYTFSGCSALTAVPQCFTNADYVGGEAFKNCASLRTAAFPAASFVGFNVFSGCSKLGSLSLDNAIYIGNQSFDTDRITVFTFPEAESIGRISGCYVKTINAPYAWVIGSTDGCTALEALNAPNLIANTVNPYEGMDVTPDGKTVIKSTDVTVDNAVYNPFEARTIPEYGVTVNGVTLTEGEDYTIAFANNAAKGTAYYKVEGAGAYEGVVTGSFSISALSLNDFNVAPIENQEYSGSLIMPEVCLIDSDGRSLQGNYLLSYSNNLNAGLATVTASGNIFAKNSASASFKIIAQAEDFDAVTEYTEYPYTGSQICPKVIVSLNGVTFTENSEYRLRYGENKNLGKGTVYIDFIGEYCSGTKALEFDIVPAALDASAFSLEKSGYSYTGSEIKPAVITSKYIKGTDFTVEYSDNVKRGTATVIITGKGNYTGTVELSFKIYYSNTWSKHGGDWYYYDENGNKTVGWLLYKKAWYYFDENGIMLTGLQEINKKNYYFNENGAMQTGWLLLDGYWHFFASSGAMQTGWVKSGGKWYYLNQFGVMQKGWQKIGSVWYYLASSGAMQTGWLKLGSAWYYFDSSGAMHTGWLKSGGKWYYFNASGVMVTGKQKIDGKRYTFDSNGALT